MNKIPKEKIKKLYKEIETFIDCKLSEIDKDIELILFDVRFSLGDIVYNI